VAPPTERAVGTATGIWAYRGWHITKEPDGRWHGFSGNYDASYEGPEDGWVDNGEKVNGATLSDACDEIDAFIEEGEEAERAYEAQDAE
jgi:hypothetical protein